MFKRYKAGFVMGAIFMAMVGMQVQAASLGENLGEGIASNFDQTTDSEEQTQATAEVVWTGTPLEGYVNIAIARVDDSLNIRETAGRQQLPGGQASQKRRLRGTAYGRRVGTYQIR